MNSPGAISLNLQKMSLTKLGIFTTMGLFSTEKVQIKILNNPYNIMK